jgi:hypothetical protein
MRNSSAATLRGSGVRRIRWALPPHLGHLIGARNTCPLGKNTCSGDTARSSCRYRRERYWSLSHRRLAKPLSVMSINVSAATKVRESILQKGPFEILKRDQSVRKGASTRKIKPEGGI